MSHHGRAAVLSLAFFTLVSSVAFAPGNPLKSAARPDTHSISPAADHSLGMPLDLYGNEVTPAIANYKLDPAGVLYEEHSPQTELPRLGTPTS